MRWPWHSRRRVPAEVAEQLGLSAGEQVLAAARLDDGPTAVATAGRLLVADPERRRLALAWHEVDSAVWEPEAGRLDVQLVAGDLVVLALSGDSRTLLPEVVRERVQSSVVLTHRVEVTGRRGVRVVVRRAPQGLVTQAIPDRGVRLDDPDVAAAVAAARTDVAREVGLDAG
jgi:antitoxin component of MazEF toxin-antitoxin module